MSEAGARGAAARYVGSWDASLQGNVADLNFRYLGLLAAAAVRAREPGAADGLAPLRTPIVELLAPEWQRMSPERLQLLAQCPYLLLDAGFAVPERWQSSSPAAVHDGTPLAARDSAAMARSGDPISVDLVRRTLVLAWHLARANPLVARITLGMSGECIHLIASRSLHQLDAVAEAQPAWVRPRWESKPEVWRQLLRAACDEQTTRLRQLQLRGVQLLAGSTLAQAAGEPRRGSG